MQHVNPKNVGFTLGALSGLCHLAWSILVALGWAGPVVNFMFRLHFIEPMYVIRPFDFMTAVGLVAMTAVVGCVVGYLFGLIWNKLQA